MKPIHILGDLKSIPHSSRTSVYTFIMEVTPPPRGLSVPCCALLESHRNSLPTYSVYILFGILYNLKRF